MDTEFEKIIPWNGQNDTGRDVRLKLERNFNRIKVDFNEVEGKFITIDEFFELIAEELTKRLRKDIADTAAGHITFDRGLTAHDFATLYKGIIKEYLSSSNFIPGLLGEGFKIYDNNGNWTAEFDNVIVRKAMTIYELIISKIRAVNGGLVISPANGRIKSVAKTTGTPQYYVLGIEGDMMFVTGDLIRCKLSSGELKDYWVEVKQVTGDTILCLVSGFNDIPVVGDDLVQMGNTTDTARQGILYLTASEDGKPRIQVLDGVNSTNLAGKNKAILGCLDGITDTAFPADYQPSGYGLWSESAWLKGIFMLRSGKTVEQDATDKANAVRTELQTQIDAVPGKITLAVSETKTYTDTVVAGVQVGARNLLRNSPPGSNKITQTATTNDYCVYYTNIYCELTADTEYTISYKSDGTKRSTHASGQDGVGIWLYDGVTHYFLGGGKTFTVSTSGKYWIRTNIYLTGKTYSFWDIKVELGNKATDWTPAPEDIDASVSALATRVTSAEALITPDAIKLTVKEQTEAIASDASLIGKGQMLYRDPTFQSGNNGIYVYNRVGNDTVSITRVSDIAGNPNDSGYCLKIAVTGTPSPEWGGFYFATPTKANRVLVTRIIAKIPVGRFIVWASNWAGDGSALKWLTSQGGTGDWAEYVCKLTCGASGSFDTTNFFYLSGGNTPTASDPLEWYIAYATVFDATGVDDTPTVAEIKAGISITTGGISIFGQELSLAGKVTFSSLSSDAQSKINAANDGLSTLKDSLKSLAYLDAVGFAKLDSTIIEGGYIKTNLIDANAIITGSLLAEKISATNITTGKLTVTVGAKIGPFTVESGQLRAVSGYNEMILTSNLMRFSESSKSTYMYVGGNVFPATMGDSMAGPCRIEVNRYVAAYASGNIGMYLSVTGSTSYDDNGYQYTGNHAFYVENGDYAGFRMRPRRVSTSQTLSHMDNVMLCINSANITLTLPSSPKEGQVYFIRKMAGGNVIIAPGSSSHKIRNGYNSNVASVTLVNGSLGLFFWDKTNLLWTANYAVNF